MDLREAGVRARTSRRSEVWKARRVKRVKGLKRLKEAEVTRGNLFTGRDRSDGSRLPTLRLAVLPSCRLAVLPSID
jgi:hypothetical protein